MVQMVTLHFKLRQFKLLQKDFKLFFYNNQELKKILACLLYCTLDFDAKKSEKKNVLTKSSTIFVSFNTSLSHKKNRLKKEQCFFLNKVKLENI